MKLLTKKQKDQLIRNGTQRDDDHHPVVKLFTPDAQCTWLLTEIDPDEPDKAFGLCDLGKRLPELGNVSLSEIEGVKGTIGLRVERDCHFEATYPLSVYTEAAQKNGRITLNQSKLDQAFAALCIGLSGKRHLKIKYYIGHIEIQSEVDEIRSSFRFATTGNPKAHVNEVARTWYGDDAEFQAEGCWEYGGKFILADTYQEIDAAMYQILTSLRIC